MSSLNIREEPWAAFPSPDTTIEELTSALVAFPDLRIRVGDELDVTLVLAHQRATPPSSDDLAQAMFAGLLSVEHSGIHELPDVADLFDLEAKDRNAEGV